VDGEQGKVVICVDADVQGIFSFACFMLVHLTNTLCGCYFVCMMNPECGSDLMVFARKRVWVFFSGAAANRPRSGTGTLSNLPNCGQCDHIYCRMHGTPKPENNPGYRATEVSVAEPEKTGHPSPRAFESVTIPN